MRARLSRLAMGAFALAGILCATPSVRGDLAGYWPFDDGTGGTLSDISGRGNHGTLAGATLPAWVVGHTGRAGDYSLEFSGSPVRNDANSPHVYLGNLPDLTITGNQTISMWLYPTDFSVRRNPYAKAYAGTGTLTQEPAKIINYYYGSGGGNNSPYQSFGAGPLIQDAWNHVAIVRDMTNNQLRWFVNGVKTTGTPQYTPAADTLPAYFARGYEFNYQGRIDDAAIFNEALNDLQVKALALGAATPADFNVTRTDWLKGWAYRQPIVISKNATTADLSGFPALVKITDPNNGVFARSRSPNGYDVVFTAADGVTLLPHELESYSNAPGSQQLVSWVKTPLSSTQDTLIYMYYSGPDVGNPSSPATWDSNYRMVQHLEETSGTANDSTQYANHMTPNGGVTQNAPGLIDGADAFDGSNDYLVRSDTLGIPASQSFTFEAWVNLTNQVSGQNQYIVAKTERAAIRGFIGGNPNLGIIWDLSTAGCCAGWDSGRDIRGAWHHVAQVYDAAAAKMYLYLDGVDITGGGRTVTASLDNGSNYLIGAWATSYGYIPGTIDEVRISDLARSPEWLAAVYRLTRDPSQYVQLGAEQDLPEPTSWLLLALACGCLAILRRSRTLCVTRAG